MKKEFKVNVVDLFRGFYVADEIVTSSLKNFKGEKLTKEEYEGYDDEADTIEFDYDFVIIDEDDDCKFYYIKEM
jgi:hypothetical protein